MSLNIRLFYEAEVASYSPASCLNCSVYKGEYVHYLQIFIVNNSLHHFVATSSARLRCYVTYSLHASSQSLRTRAFMLCCTTEDILLTQRYYNATKTEVIKSLKKTGRAAVTCVACTSIDRKSVV